MSLLDEIRAEVTSQGPSCSYRQQVSDMHPDLDKAATEALDEGIQRSAIVRFLVKRTGISPSSADRHLRGACRCQR